MRNHKSSFLVLLVMAVMSTVLVTMGSSSAQTQKSRTMLNTPQAVSKQPLYTEYKGVSLGMMAAEVRSKLGNPAFMDNELDYFVLSATESAQIGYDAARKAKVISVDYQNGIGAPEPTAVVGANLETKPDGSLYKIVRYENLGFWVSYSRTATPLNIVTITIQKL